MALDTTVKNVYGEVNGSNAKITWDKDTFAAKYELEYTMFDINGYAKNTTPLKASTKEKHLYYQGTWRRRNSISSYPCGRKRKRIRKMDIGFQLVVLHEQSCTGQRY